jgi:hypothetical protein
MPVLRPPHKAGHKLAKEAMDASKANSDFLATMSP